MNRCERSDPYRSLWRSHTLRVRNQRTEGMQQLAAAKPRGAFSIGAALSIVNPNLTIMISGMTVIAAAETSPGTAVFGTTLL